MPTELFIRRPLLWLTFASRKRATILCSPNFGYRHYLKVLGDRERRASSTCRACGSSSTARSRSPWSWPRNSWRAWRRRNCARTAMYPVYGLAEASLAVSFPQPPGADARIRRCRPARARRRQAAARRCRRSMPTRCCSWPWASRFRTAKCASPTTTTQELPEGHVGHILIARRQRHEGLLREPRSERQGLHRPDSNGWLAAHRRPRA